MLNEICTEAGLTIDEAVMIPAFIAGDLDFYGTPAYDKLYEYFCNSGEMPYGIAKARTGDPDLWMLEKLEEQL